MWKLKFISAMQILREINVGGLSNSGLLTFLGALTNCKNLPNPKFRGFKPVKNADFETFKNQFHVKCGVADNWLHIISFFATSILIFESVKIWILVNFRTTKLPIECIFILINVNNDQDLNTVGNTDSVSPLKRIS